MAAAAIEVTDLKVIRGNQVVLSSLTLKVVAGEVTGLLGPSGSGKSTLMRAIVGVQIVESGEVSVLGEPAGAASLRHRVGYVTQAPSVYADLTVRDNVAYFAKILGAPKSDIDRVLTDVDLSDFAARRVDRLSGGQRSRVSLAVALLGKPEVLVLDEPTVGLDPLLRRDLWAIFHRLAERGLGVLVSSHVMDEASRCHRLLLMRDGELLSEGSLEQLLQRTGTADIETAFVSLIEGDKS